MRRARSRPTQSILTCRSAQMLTTQRSVARQPQRGLLASPELLDLLLRRVATQRTPLPRPPRRPRRTSTSIPRRRTSRPRRRTSTSIPRRRTSRPRRRTSTSIPRRRTSRLRRRTSTSAPVRPTSSSRKPLATLISTRLDRPRRTSRAVVRTSPRALSQVLLVSPEPLALLPVLRRVALERSPQLQPRPPVVAVRQRWYERTTMTTRDSHGGSWADLRCSSAPSESAHSSSQVATVTAAKLLLLRLQ